MSSGIYFSKTTNINTKNKRALARSFTRSYQSLFASLPFLVVFNPRNDEQLKKTLPLGEREQGRLFYLFYDGFECLRVVHCEVGEHFAVEVDLFFGEPPDKFRIGQSVCPCAGVDTLDPQAAESPLFVFAIAVCVLQTLLDCVFGNSPNVSP